MKNSILTILILLTTIFISCNKDDQEISGCTDSAADNFDANATEDDGSCAYSNNNSETYTLNLFSFDPNSGGNYYTNYKVVINGDTLSQNLEQHVSSRSNCQVIDDFFMNDTYPTDGLQFNVENGVVYDIEVLDGLNDSTMMSFQAEVMEYQGKKAFYNSGPNPQLIWNTTYLNNKFSGWDDETSFNDDCMQEIDGNFFFTAGILYI